jgi:acetyl-CoA C-acetyltransferase
VTFVTIDPRTPVIVGVGQFLHRAENIADALEPAALMERGDRVRRGGRRPGSTPERRLESVVSASSRGGTAIRHGWSPNASASIRTELAYTSAGGNTPQTLVNKTALDLAAGRLDTAILAGGEAWRTRTRARRAEATPRVAESPRGSSRR